MRGGQPTIHLISKRNVEYSPILWEQKALVLRAKIAGTRLSDDIQTFDSWFERAGHAIITTTLGNTMPDMEVVECVSLKVEAMLVEQSEKEAQLTRQDKDWVDAMRQDISPLLKDISLLEYDPQIQSLFSWVLAYYK